MLGDAHLKGSNQPAEAFPYSRKLLTSVRKGGSYLKEKKKEKKKRETKKDKTKQNHHRSTKTPSNFACHFLEYTFLSLKIHNPQIKLLMFTVTLELEQQEKSTVLKPLLSCVWPVQGYFLQIRSPVWLGWVYTQKVSSSSSCWAHQGIWWSYCWALFWMVSKRCGEMKSWWLVPVSIINLRAMENGLVPNWMVCPCVLSSCERSNR